MSIFRLQTVSKHVNHFLFVSCWYSDFIFFPTTKRTKNCLGFQNQFTPSIFFLAVARIFLHLPILMYKAQCIRRITTSLHPIIAGFYFFSPLDFLCTCFYDICTNSFLLFCSEKIAILPKKGGMERGREKGRGEEPKQ